MHRPSFGSLAGHVLRRLLHPRHLWRAFRLQRNKKKTRRERDDSQLLLYSRILPSGFLHYGYFDDPKTDPREVSFNDLDRAQRRYADLLLEQVVDADAPVLDVGCGMGGLLAVLRDRGFTPVGLSPDRNQIAHVREKYPGIESHECRFEDLDAEEHRERFGTVINSESLQYLDLDAALPLVRKILKPGGRWVVCDYFRLGEGGEGSGHRWDDFRARVEAEGWRTLMQRDITPHVLPSLAYVHMWGSGVLHPFWDYLVKRLARKEPGLHYLGEKTFESLDRSISEGLEVVDPAEFARRKQYILTVMQ